MVYTLIYLLIYLLEENNEITLDLPILEYRINMLIIIGVMVLGLILLISLKIYQLESREEGEKNG